jgi:hypothetical protein
MDRINMKGSAVALPSLLYIRLENRELQEYNGQQ